MTLIWRRRRRPSLTRRILSSVILMVASIGVATGVELLRRRILGGRVVEVSGGGRRARVRVSLRASRRGRPRSRSTSSIRSWRGSP